MTTGQDRLLGDESRLEGSSTHTLMGSSETKDPRPRYPNVVFGATPASTRSGSDFCCFVHRGSLYFLGSALSQLRLV